MSDDLTQIKQMLWELNCKVEALTHAKDYSLQNGLYMPNKQEKPKFSLPLKSFQPLPVSTEEHDMALGIDPNGALTQGMMRKEYDRQWNTMFVKTVMQRPDGRGPGSKDSS